MTYRFTDCAPLSVKQLCAALNLAFSDYVTPLHLTEAGFIDFQRQRGFSPEHSFVAFDGDDIAGFWFSSPPNPDYGNRAYTLSVGSAPAHRRKGLSRQLLQKVVERQRASRASGLQLEVITTNDKAVAAYEAAGFRRSRTLGVFRLGIEGAIAAGPTDWIVEPVGLEDLPDDERLYVDTLPTPQNSRAALKGLSPDIHLLAVRQAGELLGWGACYSDGAVAQIAVRQDRRRQGIGRALLLALSETAGIDDLRFVNVDTTAATANAFLQKLGAEELLRQHEMQLVF
ncbi:GNAT family N-acetyltransferase [Roseibium sp. M-1]